MFVRTSMEVTTPATAQTAFVEALIITIAKQYTELLSVGQTSHLQPIAQFTVVPVDPV